MKNSKNLSLLSRLDKFQRLFFVALFAMLAVGASAQNKTVSGTVLDKAGESVIGASVVVKGTTNGTITDFDGNFTLQNVPANGTIQVSFVGYKTLDIPVKGQSTIKVTLEEDTETLDEVVVVGYGTVAKSNVISAVTQISEKTIKERPVQNALQAMQGKAAGVNITTNSRPGELGEVRIRGNRSINASNDPLYVIDGIPLAAGSLSDINPNDIASMEVLKDASATAIYGSRGANGVILITTKRGKVGKTTINYDGTVTFSKISSTTDWMNSGELIDWNRQALINTGQYAQYGAKYGNAPDPAIDRTYLFGDPDTYSYMMPIFNSAFQFNSDGTPVMRPATDYEKNVLGYASQVPTYNASNIPTTPWIDYVTRTAITHNHQLSLSAGSETSNLYMSLAYLNQESPMKDQDYERYTVNLNGEIRPMNWLKVGIGLNASHSIRNYGIAQNSSNTVAKDSYGLAANLLPYAPAFDENGDLLIIDVGPSEHNVLRNINSAIHEYRYYSAMLSSFAELDFGKMWKPLEGIKWRTNFGTQFRNTRQGNFYNEDFTNPYGFETTEPGVGYNNHSQNLSWTLENMIFVDKTFDIHTIGLTLLQSAEKSRSEGLWDRAQGVVFPTSLWYNLGSSNIAKNAFASSFTTESRASYMVRASYSLMNRYLLTATGRWDGASVLAAGNKWDFFPSLAMAWKLEEESFIKDKLPWVNQLKLRAGYGVTGNSAIKPYQTTGSMQSNHANISFGQGAVTTQTTGAKAAVLPNFELGWEKTASTNVGLDFGVLNNRISGSIEYYVAKTSDLLLNRSIPIQVGYTQILSNVGKTENKGLELTLSAIPVRTKDFQWSIDVTFARNREKIKALADGSMMNTTSGWFVGYPVSEIWTYQVDRLWQDNDADNRMMEIYKKAGNQTFFPGTVKLVDQDFIEVPEGTEGSKTIVLDSGEKVTYMDNGFGTFNADDNKFLGSTRPDWEGGFTTTFNYKNWQLNAFLYARIGGLYYGLMQTYGRRVEKDVWSPENQNAKYPQQRSGGVTYNNYSSYMNYTKADFISIRNIALSYSFPEKWLTKLGATSCQVYGQVLNPFILGGDLVKAGINPDDTTGWQDKSGAGVSTIGGQSNNTILTRSYVIGLRLGF